MTEENIKKFGMEEWTAFKYIFIYYAKIKIEKLYLRYNTFENHRFGKEKKKTKIKNKLKHILFLQYKFIM